jgi:uncharacterized protein (UPF0276 family)
MPPRVGIGLRAPHAAALAERCPALGFLEVHSENYFGEGGPALRQLEAFRARWPVSLHGVGLSLGSTDALDEQHLAKLQRLIARIEPELVSEHLSWGAIGGRHANDLLPLPFDEESARHVASRIAQVQERLGRPLLVENVSAYYAFEGAAFEEAQFVSEVVRRAGCRLLLDVNNVYVNARNFGFDAEHYLCSLDGATIDEIHVAGHEVRGALVIDTHAAPVSEPVWRLYRLAIERFGARPTLVEWDAALPPLDTLLAEAATAGRIAAEALSTQAVA